MKPRLLLVISMILTSLAVTAVPATAEFVGESSAEGVLELSSKTPLLFDLQPGTAFLSCASLTKEDRYAIQTKFSKVTVGPPLVIKQGLANPGPHAKYIVDPANCITEVAGIKRAATVGPHCTIQVIAPGNVSDVIEACDITSGACVTTIEAGGPNVGLKSLTLVNVETKNLEFRASLTEITSSVNASCAALGLAGGKEGTLKATTIGHGLKTV
jgi:hypothetical protein